MADPLWGQTVLLINGELSDETGRHVLTVNDGAPVVEEGLLKFDGASALRIDDELGDFAFDGDFTIEGQITAPIAGADTGILASKYAGAGTWQTFVRGPATYSGGFYGEWTDGGGATYVDTGVLVNDTQVAWAFAKEGTVSRWFVNGTLMWSQTDPVGKTYETLGSLYIGRESAGSTKFLRGSIRLRITKGVARYTADYTPETGPYPGAEPEPEASRLGGFEMGAAQVSFKPLLQRIMEARAERVKPATTNARKKARAIEVKAAQVALADGSEDQFQALMTKWLAQRPVMPETAGIDYQQLFMAQVAMQIQRLRDQDEEDALIALLT